MIQPPIGVAIAGAAGRMGRALLQELSANNALVLTGALVSAQSPWIDRDASQLLSIVEQGIYCTADLATALADASVLIDFTTPAATQQHLTFCHQQRKALVIGTTGLTAAIQQQIEQAARQIAILQAANFSVGVQLLYQLATLAANCLGPKSDIDIIERHHRHKRDIPSGTAVELAERVAHAAQLPWPACCEMLQAGVSTGRDRQSIHMAALRAGEGMGEHSVQFTTGIEQLTITHQASSRQAFAQGAIKAAQWLYHQPPGHYHFTDILSFCR